MKTKDKTSVTKHFYIGELSKRTGRSVHTIRWYEHQGLMPGVIRDNGGRRLYKDLHLNWLDLMNRLRNTGMSIAEMRRYTKLVLEGKKSVQQRRLLLTAHRDKVQATLKEWKLALKLIDRKIDFYQQWSDTGQRPDFDPIEVLAQQDRLATKKRTTVKTKHKPMQLKKW